MDNHEILKLHLAIINITAVIKTAVILIRRQNYHEGMRYLRIVYSHMNKVTEDIIINMEWINNEEEVISSEIILYELNSIHEAQKNQDYILVTDLYELTVLPLFNRIQEVIIKRCGGFICDDEKYQRTLLIMKNRKELKETASLLENKEPVEFILSSGLIVEPAMSGFLTMAAQAGDNKHYLHSNSDIIGESMYLASYWYEDKVDEYVIYGLGLGYHIHSLSQICAYQKIRIYESNLGVIAAAAAFGMLEELLQCKSVEIIYDPDFIILHSNISYERESELLLVHYPSLYTVGNKEEKEMLESYFIQYHSVKNQRKYMDSNFKRNIKCFDGIAECLMERFYKKDIYIIAGGPSLDKNVIQLNQIAIDIRLKEKSIIIAVGTVFSKLIKLGIIPDYVIASDAKPNTYVQVKGLEEQSVPIIGLSTLYYEFFKNYKGTKYIVFQKGYPPAERMAEEMNSMLFESGGSVTTLAIDMALRMDCERIILLGADFAYTNGSSHALGTHSNRNVTDEHSIYVKDINGDDIVTGKNLNIYRKWIENRIKGIKPDKLIDATEGGAYIKGTKIMRLEQAIFMALEKEYDN